MVLRFFRGTTPGVIFLIAVTILTVWLSTFFYSVKDVTYSYSEFQMPLYGLFSGILIPGKLLETFLAFSITAIILFIVVNFNTTLFFINERTFLPAILFILIVGVFPEVQLMNPVIPASLLFMVALKRIMASYQKQGVAYNFFDAGILIGTGSLFYANLIWFGIIIIIAITILRTVNLSEIAISLLGLVTPYLITFGLYYVFGYSLEDLASLIYNSLFTDSENYSFPRLTILTLIFEAILVLLSIGFIIKLQNSKKIKSRKTFTLLIWVFVISLAVYLILPSGSVELIWICAIPLCYFISHFFIVSKKRMVSEISFALMIVLVLLIQAQYIFQ